MVVTTVQAAITAMTAQAQSGREYSARSMAASRRAAYPTLANRKTAIARHSGSELDPWASVTPTKLHRPTPAVGAIKPDPVDTRSSGTGARGRVTDLAKATKCIFADQRVFVDHCRDVDIAVDTDRGKRLPPAEERVIAGEGGKHAEQRGVQPQRVHRSPVLRRGQAERERDIHQAQRSL